MQHDLPTNSLRYTVIISAEIISINVVLVIIVIVAAVKITIIIKITIISSGQMISRRMWYNA